MGLRMGCKQALEKLLPHSSPLCLFCSLSCGSFSSIEDATGTRVGAFPKGLNYKKKWWLWGEGLDN